MYTTINIREYRGYKINTGINEEYLCYTLTLDQIIDTLEYMVEHHSKVLCCLFVIHLPVESNLNLRSKMTRILESLSRTIESKSKDSPNKIDMKYIWRAERSNSEHEHIHLAILVNGNAIQSGWGIFSILRNIVKSHLHSEKDGLVDFCRSNGKYGKMIIRNSSGIYTQMDEAVYAMSYIAKARASDNKSKFARLSSASRLRR